MVTQRIRINPTDVIVGPLRQALLDVRGKDLRYRVCLTNSAIVVTIMVSTNEASYRLHEALRTLCVSYVGENPAACMTVHDLLNRLDMPNFGEEVA